MNRINRRNREQLARDRAKLAGVVCPNCGAHEAHFVPPSLGEPGFFLCAEAPGEVKRISDGKIWNTLTRTWDAAVAVLVAAIVLAACATNPPPGGGIPPIPVPDNAQLCLVCALSPSLPGCKELIASGVCGVPTPPTPTPDPKPTPKPIPVPTPTPPPPPADPHPVCSIEVPRVVDCYHRPPGSGWLYACPLVEGRSENVPRGQEATCPTAPVPPPAPPGVSGCIAPAGEWTNPKPTTTVHRADIRTVLASLAGCGIGTDCPLPDDTQQSWQAKVAATLRDPVQLTKIFGRSIERGLCAGQHEAASDQITVTDECEPGKRWENYYVFACTPARPGEVDGDGNPIDTCPIRGRGKVRWAVAADSWIASGACAATPAPPPMPPGPGPAPGCPVTLSMLDPHEPFRADLKPHTSSAGAGVDLTLWACGNDVVAKLKPDVPACLRFCCPLEGDKSATVDLDVCADFLWGKARFEPEPGSGVTIQTTPNTNTVGIAGAGLVGLCGSNVPRELDRDASRSCWTFAYPCTPDAADATKCQKNRR